ncbi:fungal-specific transcription factor domain-containing protein [Aspergillus cavernicola]|uniref:Fungal-specific transcription factor domain-containing protein n=1 Tax=Aspergillus cavernicola TaxID=176166 RepID=A0ABR4I6N8_9EURO
MTGRSSSSTRSSFRVRACDNCRLRKIKCDKLVPCSSCNALGVSCSAGEARPVTPRSRPVQNDEYEQKFHAIQDQLNTIQQTLLQISRPSPNPPAIAVSGSTPARQTAPPFEGQSSFHHETLVARDAALSAAVAARGGELNDQVSSALSSLKNSLDSHTPAPTQETTSEPGPQAREPLLPADIVVAVVKKVKARPPFFLVSQSWKDTRQLETLCQSIYFPLEPIPVGSTTLLHGLLYFVIRDYMHEGDPDLARFDLAWSETFCERNFSAGLNSYQMMVDPTLEKVQALLIGVIKAQEESDSQRCWTYLSLAFNMCQTMGMHRNVTSLADPFPVADSKRHAFWSLYTIDKNISLNIGVTSHFQDHDIDTALYTASLDTKQYSWDLINLITVEFAAIQGKVYDQLYSIGALRATEDERLSKIQTLSMDLMTVRNKLLEIDVSKGLYADSLHGMTACADFIAYSVLTVIYRAQTRARDAMAVSSQCYEAASLALHSHLKCIPYFRDRKAHKQAEYVNSILLYPSFTPFVIVFTHAITTASVTDLALLQETVKSLELMKGVSRGSMHLYTLCEAFAKTAQVVVDSRQTLTGLAQHQDGSLILPGTGPANIALPDVIWPEDLFDSHVDQADISMFLNNFIGTNRSAMDILNSNYMIDPN